jgi:hypothetical protein
MLQVKMTQRMKVCKTKKTNTVFKSLQPSFNQSFDLKVTESSLPQTFLTLQLRQAKQFPARGNGEKKKNLSNAYFLQDVTLGSIILGSAMFSRGSGLRQWNRVVSKPKEKMEELHILNMAGGGCSSII